jgi:hypothetical protein
VTLVADGVRQLLLLRSTLDVVGVRLRLLLLLIRLRLLLDGVHNLLLQFNLVPLLLDGVNNLLPRFGLLPLLPVGVMHLRLRLLRPMLVATGDNIQLLVQVQVSKAHPLRLLSNLNQVYGVLLPRLPLHNLSQLDGVLLLLPLLNPLSFSLSLNQPHGVLRLLPLLNLLRFNLLVAGVLQLLRPRTLILPAGAHPQLLRLPPTTKTTDGVLLPPTMTGRLSSNTSRQR